MLRLLKYLFLWLVINGFVAVAAKTDDPAGWTLIPSLVLASLVYAKRHRPHLLRRRRTEITSRDVVAPAHLFMNQEVKEEDQRQIAFSRTRWRSLTRHYRDLLRLAPTSFLSKSPKAVFEDQGAMESLFQFSAKHKEGLYDEVVNARLDESNNGSSKEAALFLKLMQQKHRVDKRTTLGALAYLGEEVEFIQYRNAMIASGPSTLDELLEGTVLYDLRRSRVSRARIMRYAAERGIRATRSTRKIKTLYEAKLDELRLRTFEKNLASDEERRSESIDEQMRLASLEEFFAYTSEHDLSINPSDYKVRPSDYSRSSSVDDLYKREMESELTTVFGGVCCMCGAGMGQIEFDHFWIPKSAGGNFAMQSKQGHFVNNCIPLCRTCNASKGARSFLDFFPRQKIEGIIAKSQSLNAVLNSRMSALGNP
jgi:hypothetical protein